MDERNSRFRGRPKLRTGPLATQAARRRQPPHGSDTSTAETGIAAALLDSAQGNRDPGEAHVTALDDDASATPARRVAPGAEARRRGLRARDRWELKHRRRRNETRSSSAARRSCPGVLPRHRWTLRPSLAALPLTVSAFAIAWQERPPLATVLLLVPEAVVQSRLVAVSFDFTNAGRRSRRPTRA
jgi:hypothetical protein